MTTINTKELAAFLAISSKAIEMYKAESLLRTARYELADATDEAKRVRGILHQQVPAASKEWQAILAATQNEAVAVEAARRAHYNAKRRIERAIRKHLHGDAPL